MKKILHIVTDEKFTDYAIRQFSAPEMCSEFVLIPSNGMMSEVKLVSHCAIVQQGSEEFHTLLAELGNYCAIVLHGMFWGSWQTSILKHVPDDVKVAWVFWGGDLYSRHENKELFYAPITHFFCNLHKLKRRNQHDTSWEIPLNLYKRVDYCITSIDDEYDFACDFTQSSFLRVWYSYYSIEDTIGSLMHSCAKGRNIWIGNSATPKNNHMDILWRLWKSGAWRELKDRKIIIPLSYGEPWMRNLIKKIGGCLFGKRLQVLEQYMPRDEYNALMLSCSTMIIGYREPAATGNIITALWLGMRVYLSEHSMAYSYFKRIGCRVYSIESDLDEKNANCFSVVSDEERQQNRDALMSLYGKKNTNQAVADLVTLLTK